VYAFTELMDQHKYAIVWELLKNITGIGIILYLGDWFKAAELHPSIKYLLIGYFIISMLVVTWFSTRHQAVQKNNMSMAG
jgi:hypothetical protein